MTITVLGPDGVHATGLGLPSNQWDHVPKNLNLITSGHFLNHSPLVVLLHGYSLHFEDESQNSRSHRSSTGCSLKVLDTAVAGYRDLDTSKNILKVDDIGAERTDSYM